MLTIIPNPKAMDYDKLIDFLNKRKNIELNRFKQRGDKNIKDIEYRVNKETNRPELLELLWNRGHYIHPLDQLEFKEEKYSENNTIPCTVQELVANDILDLSQYMFLTHEYVDDGFNMEIVLHGIFATLEEAGEQEVETILSQHRELRADIEAQTIENQNEFIMNELILIGNKGTTDYYQAKYEVRPEELMANQEPLDIIAMVQERFATFDHALNTPDNGIRYVSYCFQKPGGPTITGVCQNNIAYVLKQFAELGFIDELERALITAGVDESELISSARKFWPRAWYPEHENTGYELTLLTVTKDNINNRPLCF